MDRWMVQPSSIPPPFLPPASVLPLSDCIHRLSCIPPPSPFRSLRFWHHAYCLFPRSVGGDSIALWMGKEGHLLLAQMWRRKEH